MRGVIEKGYKEDPAFTWSLQERVGFGRECDNQKLEGTRALLSVRGCVAGPPVPPQSKGKKNRISM